MVSANRTIVCLAAKRSGTTAIRRVFVHHPQVQVVHPDQQVKNNEPNFWNFVAAALRDPDALVNDTQTAYERFVKQMQVIAPTMLVPDVLTEDGIFALWDKIVEHYGGVVFDKSPRYLEFDETLELLKRYKDSGRDVRLFGVMRAPWDTISSQFELWQHVFVEGTPIFREQKWLEYYARFEALQADYGVEQVPLYYFERAANDPQRYFPELLAHCGLQDIPQSYAHFRPVSVGRYYLTSDAVLRAWQPSQTLLEFARKHEYVMLSPHQQKIVRLQHALRPYRKFVQRVYYKLKSLLS
jgi:hypothetical protein